MATNKRTYPNSNFAWYNDEDRIAIVCEDTSQTGSETTSEKYDTFQGTGNLSGTITGVTRSSAIATYTTSSAHGLVDGDRVSISGTTNFNDSDLDNQTVDVQSTTTFNMTLSAETASNETSITATFTSLFIDNGLRITYAAKYGTIDAQDEDLKTEAGLDSGLHPAVLCYIKGRMFEDAGDLQKAQYFRGMYDKMMRQYPLRKSGVRTLSVPKM
tara:strand:+ start:279 stop:920 length:642 start_codon:yes stop_codon:yes gene_type:complete